MTSRPTHPPTTPRPAADSPGPAAPSPRQPATRRTVLRSAGLGLAAAAATPFLGACGSGSGSSRRRVRLRMWTWASEFAPAFAATIKRYEAENPHVTVEPRYWSFGTYSPSLQAALIAKNEADLFMPVTLTIALGRAGRVLDLRKALGADFLRDFFASTNDENVYKGGQYAVGWAAQSFGLFYNRELLGKAGVEPPETWDDLIAIAPEIRHRTGATPLAIQGTPSNQLSDFTLPLVTQITGDPQVVLDLDAHEKKGVSWNSSPVVDALAKLRRLTRAGVFDPGVLAVDQDTATSSFMNGKAAMLFSGSFFPPVLHATASKEFLQAYGIAKTPAWRPGGKHWCANQAGYTWCVSALSRHRDEALAFLRYLYEPDRYRTFMNDSLSMPSTHSAAARVTSPDIKTMVRWLNDGEGAPHIMFGQGTLTAVTNGVTSVMQGSVTPAKAAHAIEQAVVQTRRI
jgi:raffinose/stachyose/melibiose transport system substrate-binding protein